MADSEKQWKLGDDLDIYDNILDPVTFDELILTVHCNCRKINFESVRNAFSKILEIKKEDAMFLLENNIEEIMNEAKRGRET